MKFYSYCCALLLLSSSILAAAAQDPTLAILQVVEKSPCAIRAWKKQGIAPLAYMQGMALTYARSFCRLHRGDNTGLVMARLRSDVNKDAISHFESLFKESQIKVEGQGAETLRALYTLGLGLGMKESTGRYCESSSSTRVKPQKERGAGLFQTSYNIIEFFDELREVYQDYREGPSERCFTETFSKNVTCKPRAVTGSSDAESYQKFVKTCPAFATELAMLSLRLIRKHYGPINQRHVEVDKSCYDMFQQVENVVLFDTASTCQALK